MATLSQAETKPSYEFRGVNEAIRILRSGKKDDRWYAAAEFLISRATPEVTLMIEVGQALAKRDQTLSEKNKPKIPWLNILIASTLLAIIVGGGYWLASLVGVTCG